MNSFFQEIKTDIKYVALIDRYNNPLFFFNTTSKEKELNYQIHIISSIEILEYKLMNETQKQEQKEGDAEFIGLLLPLYEYEYDLGSYGYIGKNDIKIVMIKKLENKETECSDKKVQQLGKEIHTKYKNLLLNPFFNPDSFLKDKSTVMDTFVEGVFTLIKNSK